LALFAIAAKERIGEKTPAFAAKMDHMMMSDALRAVILGIVEGVTEFLPVSSTGHMLLVKRFFGLGEGSFWDSFIVLIQLGAILAIVVIYFATIGDSSSACWWRSCLRSSLA
jgi:undecaprenyl pyrophosphate phosphatase UppP